MNAASRRFNNLTSYRCIAFCASERKKTHAEMFEEKFDVYRKYHTCVFDLQDMTEHTERSMNVIARLVKLTCGAYEIHIRICTVRSYAPSRMIARA